MRRLSKVVNIVPVIAKADTLTLEERDFFKKKVSSLTFSDKYFLLSSCFPELICAQYTSRSK